VNGNILEFDTIINYGNPTNQKRPTFSCKSSFKLISIQS